jgi:hypothetical protein
MKRLFACFVFTAVFGATFAPWRSDGGPIRCAESSTIRSSYGAIGGVDRGISLHWPVNPSRATE